MTPSTQIWHVAGSSPVQKPRVPSSGASNPPSASTVTGSAPPQPASATAPADNTAATRNDVFDMRLAIPLCSGRRAGLTFETVQCVTTRADVRQMLGVTRSRRPLVRFMLFSTTGVDMNSRELLAGVLVTSAIALTGGCRERTRATPAPSVAPTAPPRAMGGGPPTAEMAIDQLGAARCEKEARCGRIGPDGSYHTRQQCLDADLMSKYDALDPANCPDGILADKLGACLEALRTERCDSDSLSSGCTVESLCAR